MKKLKTTLPLAGLILFTGASVLDGSLHPVAPDPRFTTLAGIVCLLIGLAIWRLGLRRVLFLVFTLCLAFMLAEGGYRLYLFTVASPETRAAGTSAAIAARRLNNKSVYVPHHYTLYNLRADYSNPGGTRHNRLGLRDERPLESKPNGVVRVVFIGGSTTYTIMLRDNRRIFSSRLEFLLRNEYKESLPRTRIEIVNAGMGGATSAENLLRLIFFVSEVQPDLVVIQHGINDALPRLYKGINSDFSNYRKIWSPPDYYVGHSIVYGFTRHAIERSVLLTTLARRVRWIGALQVGDMVRRTDVPVDEKFVAENDARYFDRNTRYMIAICREMGARVLLASEPFTEDAKNFREISVPQHNAILKQIAEEQGLDFFDFYSAMAKDEKHMPDGKHMNQAGSDLKADLYFDYFKAHALIPALASNSTSDTLVIRPSGR